MTTTLKETAKQISEKLAQRFPNETFKVTFAKPNGIILGSVVVTWTNGLAEHFVETALRNIQMPERVELTLRRKHTKVFIQNFLREYAAWGKNIKGVEIVGKDDDALISCGENFKKMKTINENLMQESDDAAIAAILR